MRRVGEATAEPYPELGEGKMPLGPKGSVARARRLRRRMTDAERKLWRALRGNQLDGLKFRRQTPIGPYIADFLCFEAKLVIEVDGGQHASAANEDERRTRWLEQNGYRVVRFWNNEVNENIEGVLTKIAEVADGR